MLVVAAGLFKSLRNQVMFSQDGLLDAVDSDDRTKFLTEPTRKEWKGNEWVLADNSLATAPFIGFVGFAERWIELRNATSNCVSNG